MRSLPYCLTLLHAYHVQSHLHGDPIPMLRRTQHNGVVATPAPAPFTFCALSRALLSARSNGPSGPRCRTRPPHASAWRTRSPSRRCPKTCLTTSPTKCASAPKPCGNCTRTPPHSRLDAGRSFALLGQQFVTPWIALSDGSGRYCDHLQLTLTASGNTVTAARWDEAYRRGGAPPHSIQLTIAWEHSVEEDTASALGLLLGTAALSTLILLARVIQRSASDDDWSASTVAAATSRSDEPAAWQGGSAGSRRDDRKRL